MNSGATADRVYDALKRRLLLGEVALGHKLEPALLAEDLMSSVTPVRDALHRLIGEHLVETRSGEGFYLPHLTEPKLQDLYIWNGELLALALRSLDRPIVPLPATEADVAPALAAETADLFVRIGLGSGNAEHRRAIGAANDRLHVARIAEGELFSDARDEFDAIRDAAERGTSADLRKLLSAYHRRRQRSTAAIVRALYRDQ